MGVPVEYGMSVKTGNVSVMDWSAIVRHSLEESAVKTGN